MKNKSLGEDVLSCLIEGNKRFQSGLRSVQSMATPEKLKVLAQNGQNPKCIILACSDSRVPAEMIFDQGLGDLFVLRVAGNVIAPSLLASLEFAAVNFGCPLVLVMGHTKCGAINAAIDIVQNNKTAPSKNLEDLISRLKPAVIKNKSTPEQEMVHRCTWDNVHNTIQQIQSESEIVRNLVADHKLMLVPSVFDLDSGKVSFFDGIK